MDRLGVDYGVVSFAYMFRRDTLPIVCGNRAIRISSRQDNERLCALLTEPRMSGPRRWVLL